MLSPDQSLLNVPLLLKFGEVHDFNFPDIASEEETQSDYSNGRCIFVSNWRRMRPMVLDRR